MMNGGGGGFQHPVGAGVHRPHLYGQNVPSDYVAGFGRGALAFVTRSDIGPAGAKKKGAGGMPGGLQSGPPGMMAVRPGGVRGGVPGTFKKPSQAPAGYIPGAGRGSGGFGEKKPGADMEKETGKEDLSENNYDEFGGYGSALFKDVEYEADDEEADEIWQSIDKRMDGRRKRQREQKLKDQLELMRQIRPKISDQFADLKAELGSVSDAEWGAIPDQADRSIKHRKRETFTPMSDQMIDSMRISQQGQVVNHLSSRQQLFGGMQTPAPGQGPAGTATDLAGLSAARDQMLRIKLDKMSDSVTGQTVVDPKGYLTDLNSLKVTSTAEVGDIKKARMLLTSVTTTNPKHGPGWIAAARLEEVAGKQVQARQIIKQGCNACPDAEDVWIEAARLNTPANAKVVLANAVRHLPNSVKIWLAAARLEGPPPSAGESASAAEENNPKRQRRRMVLRRALEFVPNSVKLWMSAVELEEPEDARIMLARAVECVPHAVELWLALARLEDYENAMLVLNKARDAVPTEPKIWIAASMLQEANGNDKACDKIMSRALSSLNKTHVVIDRETWLKEAEKAEEANAPVTCGAIIRATLGMGVEQADRKRTWLDDADSAETRSCVETARAIYAYMLGVFPSKKSIWLRAAALEKKHGSAESLQQLLKRAVGYCPQAEILWLMAAKETWVGGDVPGARSILMQAFAANHDSEAIWLAAVKLEWENDEYERARALLAKARTRSGSRRIWLKSALLERESGNLEQEEALVVAALDHFPTFDKLWMMAAQAAERRGDLPYVSKALAFVLLAR